jgi:hypothetical protein
MVQKNLFNIALLIIIFVGILIGRFLTPDTVEKIQPVLLDDFQMPTLQPIRERNWKASPKLKLIDNTEMNKNSPLLNPGIMKVYENKGIFIFDYGDLYLKKFSLEGTLIKKYGNGRGKNPGEFGNPSDFVVTEDGFIWIADPVNRVISSFNPEGCLIHYIRTISKPYRLLWKYDTEEIIVMPESGENLFEVYNLKGEHTDSFGKLIKNQKENFLVLDGYITSLDSNCFLYAPLYAGFILSYSKDKRLNFYIQMIEPKPLPKIIKNISGQRHVERNTYYATLCVNSVGNEVFILSEYESEKKPNRTIDVYSSKTGFYLYSIHPPEPSSYVFVTKNYLYILSKTGVSRWQR